MSDLAGLVLLDTNVVIELARAKALGQRIDEEYALRRRPERPLISIVTVGEGLALAQKFGWGESKASTLYDLLREFVVVHLGQADVVSRYASISAHCERSGRSLSDNDRWIAATAAATGALLLTTDKDFDPLDPDFLRREWIDPRPDR